jgi:hypothetical protein
MVMALFANWAFVTVPDKSVVGTVDDAEKALVPLPLTYPVKVLAPVPPEDTFKVPLRTTAPLVGVLGNRPVPPALNDETPPAVVNCRHEPAEKPSKVWVSELKRI